jgi:type IV pilus assembly protein PilV
MRISAMSSRRVGSALIESLLAVLVFSVGLLSLLALLTATLKESDNARYRSEASLLATDLVSRMWSGERSLQSLRQRFTPAADEYQRWLERVRSTLPGITDNQNLPELLIDDERTIRLTLRWQIPSDTQQHQLVVVTRLTD